MNCKKTIIQKFGFAIFIAGLLVASGCSSKTNSTIEMTGDNFEELIKNELLVVVFIPADCDSCDEVLAVIEEIQDEMPDIIVAKMDVEKNKQFLDEIKFRVKDSVPTTVMFSNGDVLDYFAGVESKEVIVEKINKVKANLYI